MTTRFEIFNFSNLAQKHLYNQSKKSCLVKSKIEVLKESSRPTKIHFSMIALQLEFISAALCVAVTKNCGNFPLKRHLCKVWDSGIQRPLEATDGCRLFEKKRPTR